MPPTATTTAEPDTRPRTVPDPTPRPDRDPRAIPSAAAVPPAGDPGVVDDELLVEEVSIDGMCGVY